MSINPQFSQPTKSVVVCVATFRRPDELWSLLESLAEAANIHPFRVVVVDNDPSYGAKDALECAAQMFPQLSMEWAHEAIPGIVAARNRGLTMLRPSDEWIVFVDDDETVPETWLSELMRAQAAYDADIVAGPVRSIFPADAPKWVLRGQFVQREPYPAGIAPPDFFPATNNTLLRRSLLDRLDRPYFDTSWSMTGGSDSELFSRIQLLEPTMVWHPPAEVSELVPMDRLDLRWITRRMRRGGNVVGRLMLRRHTRPYVVCFGVAKIVQGLLTTAVSVALGRGLRSRDVTRVFNGVGVIAACRNRLIQEYGRNGEAFEQVRP